MQYWVSVLEYWDPFYIQNQLVGQTHSVGIIYSDLFRSVKIFCNYSVFSAYHLELSFQKN